MLTHSPPSSPLLDTLSREMNTRESLKGDVEQMQKTFIQRQTHDDAVIRGLQRYEMIYIINIINPPSLSSREV